MVQAEEVEALCVSELDEVWSNVRGLGQRLQPPLDLETVLANRVWVLIFEVRHSSTQRSRRGAALLTQVVVVMVVLQEFRVHKLQSIDRVLRRLNKWLRICECSSD
jgi:hypothetical protein